MIRNLMVLQVFVLLITANCGDRKSFYPLGENQKWTYQLTSTVGEYQTGAVVVTNMPKRELSGQSVTPRKIEARGQTAFSFVGEDSKGIYVLAQQALSSSEPSINANPPYDLYRPFEKGTKWEYLSRISTEDTATIRATIQSDDETVTVPAGTFENCLKVVAQGEKVKNLGDFMQDAKISQDEISWYCPGVGLVKSITKKASYEVDKNGEILLQLESYEGS